MTSGAGDDAGSAVYRAAMEAPADRHRQVQAWPRRSSLVVLAVAALAMIATSPGQPSLDAQADSELTIDRGSVVTRDVRVRLTGSRPLVLRSAELMVGLRTVGDLSDAYSDEIQIGVQPIESGYAVGVRAGAGARVDLPLDDCADGCDLTYRVTFRVRDGVGPSVVIRYAAVARFTYDYSSSSPPDGALTVTLDGGEVPPVGLGWVLAAAVAGLVGGIRLGRRYRRPTTAGLAAGFVLAAILVVAALLPLTGRPTGGLAFSAALLLAHAGMLAYGLRRWRAGQPWILGLAAFSTVALCGLWLAWVVAMLAVLPRFELSLMVGLLGAVAGAVLGQTWDRRELALAGRTVHATAVVVSQGSLMAGLIYVSLVAFIRTGEYDMTPNALGLVPLGVAALVGWSALRWFAGSGGMMLVVDILLVAIGLLGSFLWFSFQAGSLVVTEPGINALSVMIVIEVLAALVGVVVARSPLDRQVLGRSSTAADTAAEPEPSA